MKINICLKEEIFRTYNVYKTLGSKENFGTRALAIATSGFLFTTEKEGIDIYVPPHQIAFIIREKED